MHPMIEHLVRLAARAIGASAAVFAASAVADLEEFRIKREAVFEFAQKPAVKRQGDRIEITFAAKGFCDATVAIEDAGGGIVRHIASGVLGQNAPEPFQKNSLTQKLIWDGKDDEGKYIDDKDALTIRVSLGLAPRYERPLYWEPRRRLSSKPPPDPGGPRGRLRLRRQDARFPAAFRPRGELSPDDLSVPGRGG
jgi:hypothetical protein